MTGRPAGADEPPFKVVAYVPNWVDLEKFIDTIQYDKLTHVNIAFENPKNEHGELSFDSANDLLLQKCHENGIKVLVSIGGGAASGDEQLKSRYGKLLSSEHRAQFAKTLVEYVQTHGFDGLDVDIEGPSITSDYGPFIAELSQQFRPAGKLLTAALSQGYGGNNVPNSVFEQFDFINIMAYDGAGSWNPNAPGQHSSFEFAVSNTEYWLKRGLPKDKAILGLPFYGYGFGSDFRNGGIGFDAIIAKYPGAENKDQIGNTIWYNGISTIESKTAYALNQKLGGVMIWSLDNDVSGDKSLLNAIDRAAGMLAPSRANQLLDCRTLAVTAVPEIDRMAK